MNQSVMAPRMQPNPVLIRAGLNPYAQGGQIEEKRKLSIPTWLIILVIVLFLGVVGFVIWRLY
jgi:heme/copper-type cytochrome/quinol oxidase subunit 2